MNISKEKLKTNTILFVAILIFIKIFEVLFGSDNTVVGVAVITAALVLLQRDLTRSVKGNLSALLIFNLFLGIFSYFADANIWLAIPLNLIGLFTIGYFCSSNLKSPIVIPFGLLYLFMLFEPVYGVDFIKRLCALAFGAFFIMGIQYLANMGKFKKSFKPLILGVLDGLEGQIKEENLDCTNVFAKLDNLKKIILEKRKQWYYLSEEGKEVTDIIWLFERISIEIHSKKTSLEEDKLYKNSLLEVIEFVKKAIKSTEKENINTVNFKPSTNSEFEKLNLLFENLISKIDTLCTIEDLKAYDCNDEITKYFNKKNILKREFKLSSLKVSYGLRLAVIATLAIFIAQYFKLQEGKWMAYTVFSLVQPYVEVSRSRMKDRVEGTIIGAILIVVLFFLVKSPAARGLIILVVGYLNPFADRYKSTIVLVTVSAIASTALVGGGTLNIAMERIGFVFCGMFLALLGSKYIIKYRIEDGNKEIFTNYSELKLLLDKEIKNNQPEDSIKSLYLMPAFFEEKLKSVNTGERLKSIMDFVYSERVDINKSYEKYIIGEKLCEEVI